MMDLLPQFKSFERISKSLIGRILNPDCQEMSSLILDMPRKWQKLGKVRGVALSKEHFQFIFDHEHDLLEILEKGVHTYNDWALAIDQWVEITPPDFLQFILICVQIRNIHVNYCTKEAITAFGELLGEVKVVAFDLDKPPSQDYVRVLIRFNVSRPLKKSRVVNLPERGSSTIYFSYERIQKRCYYYQRFNHAKEVFPLLVRKRRELASERRHGLMKQSVPADKFIDK